MRRPEPDSSPAQGREQKAGIPTKTSVAGTAFLATRRQSLCPEAEKRVMTLSGCSKHRGQPPFLFHLLWRTVLKGAVACFAQRRCGPTELYELLREDTSDTTFRLHSCGHAGGNGTAPGASRSEHFCCLRAVPEVWSVRRQGCTREGSGGITEKTLASLA